MRRSTNAWHDAICAQLSAAGRALSVVQILHAMETAGFRHKSAMPRATLGARIAELVQMKKLERVGPALYRLTSESQA
jgi:hypothetical protein